MHPAITTLRHSLIVSCQAEGDDPFNRPDLLALFARAAAMGGASGIRACEPENIRAIRDAVSLPIIGITKASYSDGSVLITGSLADIEAVCRAGAEIVAVDATDRQRPNGLRGAAFVAAVKARFDSPVVADISTYSEALAAIDAGADIVATTLSGYTPATQCNVSDEPDWDLLENLVPATATPVIMEGRIWRPDQARRALELGAYAVVVGTAITRPRVVTRVFAERLGMRSD